MSMDGYTLCGNNGNAPQIKNQVTPFHMPAEFYNTGQDDSKMFVEV